MAAKYPVWDRDEYNCLKPDLSGPIAMYKRMEIEKQITLASKELHGLQTAAPLGEDLRQLIETRVLERKNDQPEQNRRETLAVVVESLRHNVHREALHQPRHRSDIDLTHISNLYFGFDIDTFQADFESLGLAGDSSEQIKAIETRIKKLNQSKRGVYKKPERYFSRSVPKRWRDRAQPTTSVTEMAEIILKSFLSDWRTRAMFFTESVTVTGTAIRTLPTTLQEIWLGLYKTVGLDKIPKRAEYVAFLSDLPADSDAIADDKVPEMFQGAA